MDDLLELDQLISVDENFLGAYVDHLSHKAVSDMCGVAECQTYFPESGNPPSQAPTSNARDGSQRLMRSAQAASSEMPDSLDMFDETPYDSSRPKRRRIRNAEQQAQNKVAQQRYRERRKQRFQELEEAVTVLSTRLDELQQVEAQNILLKDKNVELEEHVKQHEVQLDRLRLELQAMGTKSVDQDATDAPLAPVATSQSRVKAEFDALIAELRKLVADHSLDPRTDEHVSEEVVTRIRVLLKRGGCLCLQFVRDGDWSNVKESVDCDTLSGASCAEEQPAPWPALLHGIALTDCQSDQLLALRQDALAKLRNVFEERQRLNMLAMGLMLPHPANLGQANDPTVEGRLKYIESNGYCPTGMSDLASIIDNIRANLRLERRVVLELNYQFMSKVLRPVQAACALHAVYPNRVDAMALSGVLLAQRGDTQQPQQRSECSQLPDGAMPASDVTTDVYNTPASTSGVLSTTNVRA